MNEDFFNAMSYSKYLSKEKNRKLGARHFNKNAVPKRKFDFRNKNRYLRINHPLGVGRFPQGAIMSIQVSSNDGLPLEYYWLRRLKQAKYDNCIEFVSYNPKTREYESIKEVS